MLQLKHPPVTMNLLWLTHSTLSLSDISSLSPTCQTITMLHLYLMMTGQSETELYQHMFSPPAPDDYWGNYTTCKQVQSLTLTELDRWEQDLCMTMMTKHRMYRYCTAIMSVYCLSGVPLPAPLMIRTGGLFWLCSYHEHALWSCSWSC